MTTSVPAISFTPTGLVLPLESAIIAGVIADMNAAFGGNMNPGLNTPQGQFAQTIGALVGDKNNAILNVANQIDPATSQGLFQNAIGALYFITRLAAQSTVLQVQCVGAVGSPIPVGATVQDPSGNIYACTGAGVVPVSGTVTLSFAAIIPGPTAVPASVTIYQTVPGLNTVSVVSGVVGTAVESQQAFELRRQQSVAGNAVQVIQAVQAAVLQVPGVLDAYSYDNSTGAPIVVGGVTVAASSIYVSVAGGAAAAVAKAIWLKKGAGAGYTGAVSFTASIAATTMTVTGTPFGTIAIGQTLYDTSGLLAAGTTITAGSGTSWTISPSQTVASESIIGVSPGYTGTLVQDTNSGYNVPYPGYIVVFNVPTTMPFVIQVNLATNSGIPSNALTLIQAAVIAAFTGTDGGQRARIGSTVFASRFYAGVAALGSWAQIRSILIGSSNSTGATIATSTIAGTTLTVGSVSSGTIAIGQTLTDLTGQIMPGTTIVSGSGLSWVVSVSQTVTSETMYLVTPALNSITANINQIPALASANVTITST